MTDCLTIGDMVPDFEIEIYDPKNYDFSITSLNQMKNEKKWTILFFYPADFTFVCPTELADLARKYKEFQKQGVEIIGISTDTKFVHMAWHREEKLLEGLKFPLGADPAGKLVRLFGIYNEENGLARRGTFIINPEGRIVGSEISFDNVGRNANELLRKVRAHIYVTAHPEQACPANWSEKDQTLTPGSELVGKVGEALKAKA
jgi:peroxiredoxin (alkyl hydroperoxide reductase subunit C)